MSSSPARIADPATRRQLSAGELIGSVEADGTHAWRGIRYAQPPVGALRWRAPQPWPRWPGVQPALQHGAMAPQYGGALAPVPPAQWGQVVGDEDCLSLNIFAPAWQPGEVPQRAQRRPVMVWIHGGGNAVGTAASYDVARNLARHDDVVVVTVNYRLGLLGWFTHPALQQEPDTSAEERSGNFALLDLVAALHWVREHISAFGGDPDCVTLFGESAGGQNVLLLMASPLAAGLFHRAVAQSPVCQSFSTDAAVHGQDSPIASERCGSLALTQRLRDAHPEASAAAVNDADFLRALSPAQLLGVVQPGSVGIYLTPRPTRDGVVLPEAPLTEVFASGQFNRVPVILGSNRDEYRTFLADKPEHSRLLFGKLPLLRDRAAYLAESDWLSRAWRAAHVDAPADAMLAGGHADVWTYRFDWDELPAIPFIRPDLLLGASHAMEMAFVFRDVAGEFDPFRANTPFNRSGRAQVAQAMGDAWTSLARSGQPSLPDQIAWPRRSLLPGPDSLLIDSQRGGGLRQAALRSSLAETKQALMGEEGGLSAAQRARTFARVFLWSPLFSGHADEADYLRLCARLGHRLPSQAHRPMQEI